jgi:hypothetical protein
MPPANACRLAAALMLLATPPQAQQDQTYTVSVQALQARADEVVVSFEIDVLAGAFDSVSKLPVGWYVDLDNDPSWNTKLKASIRVGAAALKPDELKKLRFRLRKNEFRGARFTVSGTVALTTDFATNRQVPLQMSDFSVVQDP